MSTIRYAARPQGDTKPKAIGAWSTSLTATFLTDPDIVAAVLPPPLEAPVEPLVKVGISQVNLGPDYPMIGAGTFAVAARHDGNEGFYPLLMPMTTEQAVVGGREVFGEPKKLAQMNLVREGDDVHASVTRMGVTIIEIEGRVGPALEPPAGAERLDFYFKFLRNPDGSGFDADPWLVYCSRDTETRSHSAVAGSVTLRESRYDPVADIPILGEVTITLSERRSTQTGRLVSVVDPAGLLPFVHQRYDEARPPASAGDAEKAAG